MGGDWRSWKAHSYSDQHNYSSVPLWEKKFCTSVCHVPWDRICAAKHWISGFKNIAEWDDSGAHEAFNNAKVRYWAEINGLPCENPMPDPDIYIDKVDHNAVIDPELVADLYKNPPPPPPSADKFENLSYEAFLSANLPIKATGWGDPEEGDRIESHPNWDASIEKPLPATGWGDAEDHQPNNWNSENLWDENENQRKQGSWGRHWERGQGRRNGRKKNGYDSRFSRPRGQISNYQPNSFALGSEKTVKPMAKGQWMPKAGAPINGQ